MDEPLSREPFLLRLCVREPVQLLVPGDGSEHRIGRIQHPAGQVERVECPALELDARHVQLAELSRLQRPGERIRADAVAQREREIVNAALKARDGTHNL
jgi:hypothetical protein